MSIGKKSLYTVLAIFFGTIIFGLVRDLVGVGEHLVSGLLALLLIYIWYPRIIGLSHREGKNKEDRRA